LAVDLGFRHLVSACVPENERVRHLYSELGWSFLGRVDYVRAGVIVWVTLRRPNSPTKRLHTLKEAAVLVFPPEPAE
jgi:hypothetical protein